MDSPAKRLVGHLLQQSSRVKSLQKDLTGFPALGPENGGQGESAKADYVKRQLPLSGHIIELNSPDPRVERGFRPNLAFLFECKSQRRLWLFAHLDVVPAGESSLWDSNPWEVREEDGLLYGRGVEDNQQAIVSMILLAESLHELAITPELGLGLIFMADEECGSKHGLGWILNRHPELFSPEDLYIVPDGGSPDASEIEIAEKGQLWLKFTVLGRQCHASTPDAGINAFVAASWLVCALAKLREIFPEKNPLFTVPVSTFAPTRHSGGAEAINIIPGKEVFWLDCRLLPGLEPGLVLEKMRIICAEAEKKTGAKILIEVVQTHQATEVSPKTYCVAALSRAIKKIYGVEAKPVGIGGATVAALLRDQGLPGVVWSCLKNTCHQPNECSSIEATLRDAAVFAEIIMDPENV